MSRRLQLRFPLCRAGLWLLAAALGTLSGCARPELLFPDLPPIDPLAEPTYGLAQICVIRPHTLAMLDTVPIEDNGHLVGATRGPSYFCYAAQPGAHRIEIVEYKPRPTLELKVAAGQRSYIHLRVGIGRYRLAVLPEDRVQEQLDKCEYSQLVETPNMAVYTEAPALPEPSLARPVPVL